MIYGAAIAGGAFALEWLKYRHALRSLPTEYYIVAIALLFTLTGALVGHRLTRAKTRSETFVRNDAAIEELGISSRETQVLEMLAEGHTNQEIAAKLFVSPNTIKTHLKNIYAKLGVTRRTQAIRQAREQRLLP